MRLSEHASPIETPTSWWLVRKQCQQSKSLIQSTTQNMHDPDEDLLRDNDGIDIFPSHMHRGAISVAVGGVVEFVHPPNFIEKLFGVTFEGKVHKAVGRAKVKAQEADLRQQLVDKVKKDHGI